MPPSQTRKISKRIFGQHRRSVKKNIPEPPTEENAKQRCIEDEIADLVFPQRTVSFSSEPFHQVKCADESGDVSKAVPSDAELFVEPNEERTEMVNVEGEDIPLNSGVEMTKFYSYAGDREVRIDHWAGIGRGRRNPLAIFRSVSVGLANFPAISQSRKETSRSIFQSSLAF